jgi:glutathione S-transferase
VNQKPLFRTTTGLIPSTVWSSPFGTDRAQLIGHTLNPTKLDAKVPQNLANLDLHLTMLEPGFCKGTWAVPTKTPSLADVSLYYQLKWGVDMAAGRGIHNLTGGATQDTQGEGAEKVFNGERYPGLWRWFHAFETYIASLPDLENTLSPTEMAWKDALRKTPLFPDGKVLVPAAVAQHLVLDKQRGLLPGVLVSVAPDDTGRGNPTVGTLVRIGVEEVVIQPIKAAEMEVRIHFPRLGFVVKVVEESRL